MGCERSFHIVICTIFYVWLLSFAIVRGSTSSNSSALDASIGSFAEKALIGRRTGIFWNVSLPANFSDMKASVIRLRSRSFWEKGVDFTPFYIPPRVLPFPFVKRLSIVFQNLGNWSDYYYKVPSYSLVAPVVGFVAYDDANLTTLGHKTRLYVFGELIAVRFSKINLKVGNSSKFKCVKFGENGLIEFRNLTENNICLAQSDGHFSIVVPSAESAEKKRPIRWQMVAVICAGVVLVVMILVNFYKMVRSKKISKMKSESDKGLAFDMIWIGDTKLPSASMVRTQPALEHDDIP